MSGLPDFFWELEGFFSLTEEVEHLTGFITRILMKIQDLSVF